MASLEQVVAELFYKDSFLRLREDVLYCIWDKIASVSSEILKKFESTERLPYSSRSSLSLRQSSKELGASVRTAAMISKLSPKSMTSDRIGIILKVALNPTLLAVVDFYTLKASLICLQTIDISPVSRLKESQDLFEALYLTFPSIRDILLGRFCSRDEVLTGYNLLDLLFEFKNSLIFFTILCSQWFSVCEEAIHTLFYIHPYPDKMVQSVILSLYQELSIISNTDGQKNNSKFARLIFLLGQTALNTLVYTEKLASLSKKAKDFIKTEKKESTQSSVTSLNGKEDEVDAMETEMGLAVSADADHEMVS
jgi:hypothetical protein